MLSAPVDDGGERPPPPAESPPESRVRVALVMAGLRPVPGIQIARDDVRLRALLDAGRRVIRLGASDLRDLDAVVARVRAELGAR